LGTFKWKYTKKTNFVRNFKITPKNSCSLWTGGVRVLGTKNAIGKLVGQFKELKKNMYSSGALENGFSRSTLFEGRNLLGGKL
jgi:hypothetical protein